VWETVVFVLNAFAFVLIGLQLGPIWERLEAGGARTDAILTAVVVLSVTIAARFAWVMSYNTLRRRRRDRPGETPRPRPTVGGGIVVSWAGMRGIVTLAAALALPVQAGSAPFPFRDLIVFTAFSVVLGTLVIQGLTLRPVLQALDLHDDDPVGKEVELARERALQAALATLSGDGSPVAEAVREELATHLEPGPREAEDGRPRSDHADMHRRAIAEARRTVFEMRAAGDIGDAAFHRLEEQFDWAELGITAEREGAS
jgi:CPA1 family monovalent cation:H+ antiporter